MTLILSLVLTCWLSIPEPPQSEVSENSNAVWMGAIPGDIIEEVGGCTGGPTIINFENQTIEMC